MEQVSIDGNGDGNGDDHANGEGDGDSGSGNGSGDGVHSTSGFLADVLGDSGGGGSGATSVPTTAKKSKGLEKGKKKTSTASVENHRCFNCQSDGASFNWWVRAW